MSDMTNEELLVQVGRIIGETVQASEVRMTQFVTQLITDEVSGLRSEMSTRLDRVEVRLAHVEVELKSVKDSVDHLTKRVNVLEISMCQMRGETEKMAVEIAAGLENKRPLPM